MEFSISGSSLKTLSRSITCLARIGNELVFQSSPSQLSLHTLNSSRSAYQSITFKPDFFDVYSVSGALVQCSVLLKAICSVLRTPIASIDHLNVVLPDSDSSKVQWTLECFNGMRKSYWITCNVEPDIQHLSLDRRKLPSSFVVRPRDLNRLLSNFQSTLQEITIIATQLPALPLDAADEVGGKAVELRSYLDPTKENDSSLHTQLWIDPTEEFVQYTHSGDPVDVTFGVKELKAFLAYCEGCEVDVHLYLDKAGEPILMAPKFGLDDDGSTSNFDASLVLATMLVSQLNNGGNSSQPHPTVANNRAPEQQGTKGNTCENPSDHTRIWSELSGSAVRDSTSADRRVIRERNQNTNDQGTTIQRIDAMNISLDNTGDEMPARQMDCHVMETDVRGQTQGITKEHVLSQRHRSNWVDADEEDDEGDETELYVESTPPYL
ncbi:hypothetical protein ABFS82_07G087800 [Erythranthe guttata]|uniref:cell cycle checkpoint control protein RAD9A-like isoform X2 n=1 Tax=Erythranthe guttata TaxID=4155 RepID=UPI00064DFADE|nr:PREDICTED: cell cycle checkpoint control protein RAD9A-like isoform X2 [Erythranthe guttata]|eukprot:XP_012837490.1 PREDICTED: cell cycle checkpoint control protein RAD9A-like isoform X2 [Erythranthe guttata]